MPTTLARAILHAVGFNEAQQQQKFIVIDCNKPF